MRRIANQVLLLDEQTGPFEDALIRPVFSPSHPVLRVSSLRRQGAPRARLRRALFVPPGYSSVLLAPQDRLSSLQVRGRSYGYCTARGGSRLLRGYRRFALDGLGVPAGPTRPQLSDALAGARSGRFEAAWSGGHSSGSGAAGGVAGGGGVLLRLTFVSRRPYVCGAVEHRVMNRQVLNEDEVLARLRALPGADVARLDLACRPPREQAAAMAATDVLVAMHGAALTHAVFLPDGAAVVEIAPAGWNWRMFEHLSRLRGLGYYDLPTYSAAVYNETGEHFSVDPAGLARVVECALAGVRAARGSDVGPSSQICQIYGVSSGGPFQARKPYQSLERARNKSLSQSGRVVVKGAAALTTELGPFNG